MDLIANKHGENASFDYQLCLVFCLRTELPMKVGKMHHSIINSVLYLLNEHGMSMIYKR